jgi:hypothetical protein
MPSEALLARTDRVATRNFRRPQFEKPPTGIVIFPKPKERHDTVVDEVLRPRGTEERAFHAVTSLLGYDQRITDLRKSQERSAASIKERLRIIGENGKKTHLLAKRHDAQLENHGRAIRDNTCELLRLAQEMEATDGMTLQNQEDVTALSEQVTHHDLELDRANLRIDMERDANLHHQTWLKSHEARVRKIEQALAPRPTKALISGFDWKLAGAWMATVIGAGITAAHFLHLL